MNLIDPITIEEKQKLSRELSFDNFNGTRHTVTFADDVIKVEHGFAFTPTLEGLTVNVAWRKGDVSVYLADRDPDSKYVYLRGSGAGQVGLNLLHPNQSVANES